MRDFVAERIEKIPPILFHHYHDNGFANLHEGCFRVHFSILQASKTVAPVVSWITENCGIFDLEDILTPEWNWKMEKSPAEFRATAIWHRAFLFTNEDDATLTYLKFK